MVLSIIVLLMALLGMVVYHFSLLWGIGAVGISLIGIVLPIVFRGKLTPGRRELISYVCGGLALAILLVARPAQNRAIREYQSEIAKVAEKVPEDEESRRIALDQLHSSAEKDIVLTNWSQSRLAELADEEEPDQEKLGQIRSWLDQVQDKTSVEYYYASNSYLFLTGENEELLKNAMEAADRYPDRYDFVLQAGGAAVLAEKYETAQYYYGLALDLGEHVCETELCMAELCILSGEPDAAQGWLDQAESHREDGDQFFEKNKASVQDEINAYREGGSAE